MKRAFSILLVCLMALVICITVSADNDTWTCPDDGRVMEHYSPRCTLCGKLKSDAIWECSLGHQVNLDAAFCPYCGESRKDAAAGTPVSETAVSQVTPISVSVPAVDDIVTFGTFPQTVSGIDRTAIEWIVIDVDVSKNRALLLSRYGLTSMPYHAQSTAATWQNSDARFWLNNNFYGTAFTPAEQDAILTTEVDNSPAQGYEKWSTDSGSNTKDKVFLLSYKEVQYYFGVEEENVRGAKNNYKSRTSATYYAIANGAYINGDKLTSDGNMACWWWLRSPGTDRNRGSYVRTDGAFIHLRGYRTGGCLRPAIWVDLTSGLF